MEKIEQAASALSEKCKSEEEFVNSIKKIAKTLEKTFDYQNKAIKVSKQDWLFIKEKNYPNFTHTVIFDGWKLFNSGDNLNWNINWVDENWQPLDSQNRFEKILEKVQKTLWENSLVIGANFKKPDNKILKIDGDYGILFWKNYEEQTWNSSINLKTWNTGYYDTIFIENPQNLASSINKKSLYLVWAVADCATICGLNKKTWAISITHAGWQWIVNWVLETIVKAYKENWDLEYVYLDFSPMAGINYEWNISKFKKPKKFLQELLAKKEFLETQIIYYSYKKELNKVNNIKKWLAAIKFQLFLKKLEKYWIDVIKDWILVPYKNNPEKWHLYLDKLIKAILLKLWVPEENMNFYPEYTTDLNNSWPSYRIHSLFKKWVITPQMTQKSKNGIVYDSRIIVTHWLSFK